MFSDPTENGQCKTLFLDLWNQPTEMNKVFNWAQNPYAGTYLTDITDTFGNHISINYYGQDSSNINTPFVRSIDIPGMNQDLIFSYDNHEITYDNDLTIDSKLTRIDIPSPKQNTKNEIHYIYNDNDLLILECTTFEGVSVSILDSSSCYVGTKYEYEYDPLTQELIAVTLPTGARIKYDYIWKKYVPSYNPLTMQSEPNYLFEMDRRVVNSRTLIDNQECFGGCVWNYDYDFEIQGNYYISKTTVTDPLNNQVITEAYSTISPTLSYTEYSNE